MYQQTKTAKYGKRAKLIPIFLAKPTVEIANLVCMQTKLTMLLEMSTFITMEFMHRDTTRIDVLMPF